MRLLFLTALAVSATAIVPKAFNEAVGVIPIYTQDAPPDMASIVAFEDAPEMACEPFDAGYPYSHTHAVLRSSTACAAPMDFDQDGFVDLFTCVGTGPDKLLRNLGNDTFVDVGHLLSTTYDPSLISIGAAWADVDNDGDADLFVTVAGLSAANTSYHKLYMNHDGGTRFTEEAVARGTQGFQQPGMPQLGSTPIVGDIDVDGHLDVVLCNWCDTEPLSRRQRDLGPNIHSHASMTRILHNRGAQSTSLKGYYEDVTETWGAQEALSRIWCFGGNMADIDESGYPSLLITGDFGTSKLLQPTFDSSSSSSSSSSLSSSLQLTDATLRAGLSMDIEDRHITQGGAHVQHPENVDPDEYAVNGMGSSVADLDGDGHPEWMVTDIYQNMLNLNGGGARLNEFALFDRSTLGFEWGATMPDYDNDGDRDIAITNNYPTFTDRPTPTQLFVNPSLSPKAASWSAAAPLNDVGPAVGVGLFDSAQGRSLVSLDFNHDGRQDLFQANSGQEPLLFHNIESSANGWVRVLLQGVTSNTMGIGARVYVCGAPNATAQFIEYGAHGSGLTGHDERVAHFGVGAAVSVNVVVYWPVSGRTQVLNDVAPNTEVLVREDDNALVPSGCEYLGETLGRLGCASLTHSLVPVIEHVKPYVGCDRVRVTVAVRNFMLPLEVRDHLNETHVRLTSDYGVWASRVSDTHAVVERVLRRNPAATEGLNGAPRPSPLLPGCLTGRVASTGIVRRYHVDVRLVNTTTVQPLWISIDQGALVDSRGVNSSASRWARIHVNFTSSNCVDPYVANPPPPLVYDALATNDPELPVSVSSATPSSTPTSLTRSRSGLSSSSFPIAIVIGAAVALLACVLLVILLVRRGRRQQQMMGGQLKQLGSRPSLQEVTSCGMVVMSESKPALLSATAGLTVRQSSDHEGETDL